MRISKINHLFPRLVDYPTLFVFRRWTSWLRPGSGGCAGARRRSSGSAGTPAYPPPAGGTGPHRSGWQGSGCRAARRTAGFPRPHPPPRRPDPPRCTARRASPRPCGGHRPGCPCSLWPPGGAGSPGAWRRSGPRPPAAGPRPPPRSGGRPPVPRPAGWRSWARWHPSAVSVSFPCAVQRSSHSPLSLLSYHSRSRAPAQAQCFSRSRVA